MSRYPDTFTELRKASALLRELDDCELKADATSVNLNASFAERLGSIESAISRCRALEEMPQHAAEATVTRLKFVAAAEQTTLARVLLSKHPHEVRAGLPALDRAHELIDQVYRALGLAVLAGKDDAE